MRRLNQEEIESYGSVFISCWERGETATITLPGFVIQRELSDRSFAITKSGLYCLVTDDALEGDFVAILKGAKVPVVLRRRIGDVEDSKDRCEYHLIGPAYVHGLMDGEAMALADEGILEKQVFMLI